MNAPPLFLTPDELRELTGRSRKADQVAQLRTMGIPFHVNAAGKPVVTRVAVEGRAIEPANAPAWQPRVLRA